MNDIFGHPPTLTELPRGNSHLRSVFGSAKKIWWRGLVGPLRSEGMEAVLQLPAKHQVYRVADSPRCLFHADTCHCSFLFPFTEGANSGRIWRNGQECVLVSSRCGQWAWSTPFQSSIGLS